MNIKYKKFFIELNAFKNIYYLLVFSEKLLFDIYHLFLPIVQLIMNCMWLLHIT